MAGVTVGLGDLGRVVEVALGVGVAVGVGVDVGVWVDGVSAAEIGPCSSKAPVTSRASRR